MLLVSYSIEKHLHSSALLVSMNKNMTKFIVAPTFCSVHICDKTVSLISKTLCMYHLNWLNDQIRVSDDKTKRKKKIVTHQ